MSVCKWTVEGHITKVPSIEYSRGGQHTTIHLNVDNGEIVMFCYEKSIIKEIRDIKPGNIVRFQGIIEPRNPNPGLTTPYFLNPLYMETIS